MKFSSYILDKWLYIILSLLTYGIILLMMLAFKVPYPLIWAVSVVMGIFFIVCILISYQRRRKFYTNLINNVDKLDKKYLVLEMMNEPNFYDGKILYQVLYETFKSMRENVKDLELSLADYKDYVELWIHEIKIPISSLVLLKHNQKDGIDNRFNEQIKRIDDYVDQILYFVRSENAEKDYLIKEINLAKVVNKVALKNKDDLLAKDIDLKVSIPDITVLSDAKWLEFIINQIVNNSMKYIKDNTRHIIEIKAEEFAKKIELSIYDNGIGIKKGDLKRVFDKTFTGENGHGSVKSTGMGLYIVRKLCDKLGCNVEIESIEGKYTKVIISFAKNDFYKI